MPIAMRRRYRPISDLHRNMIGERTYRTPGRVGLMTYADVIRLLFGYRNHGVILGTTSIQDCSTQGTRKQTMILTTYRIS